MNYGFHYAAISDVGKIRKNNQDSGFAGENLLVLADGMGGPAGGDIASSVAVDHLRPLNQSVAIDSDQAFSQAAQAIEAAHRELIGLSSYQHELRGLGTTCIALRRGEDFLCLTHIGDSRAYVYRDQQLIQITRDHSLVQQLVDSGQITPDEVKTHPMRSVLIRVLGDANEMVGTDLDQLKVNVQPGDRWLLCSDGLCGFVEEETLQDVLSRHPQPEDACMELVDLALRAGGPDNITCIVADLVPEDSPCLGVSATTVEIVNTTNQATAQAAGAQVEYLAQLPGALSAEPTESTQVRPGLTQGTPKQANTDDRTVTGHEDEAPYHCQVQDLTVGAAATNRLANLRAQLNSTSADPDVCPTLELRVDKEHSTVQPADHPGDSAKTSSETFLPPQTPEEDFPDQESPLELQSSPQAIPSQQDFTTANFEADAPTPARSKVWYWILGILLLALVVAGVVLAILHYTGRDATSLPANPYLHSYIDILASVSTKVPGSADFATADLSVHPATFSTCPLTPSCYL